MDNALKEIVVIFSGIIAVALLAVLVSKNANTSGVLTAAFGGLGTALTAAEGPVSSGNGFGSLASAFGNTGGNNGNLQY